MRRGFLIEPGEAQPQDLGWWWLYPFRKLHCCGRRWQRPTAWKVTEPRWTESLIVYECRCGATWIHEDEYPPGPSIADIFTQPYEGMR